MHHTCALNANLEPLKAANVLVAAVSLDWKTKPIKTNSRNTDKRNPERHLNEDEICGTQNLQKSLTKRLVFCAVRFVIE